MTAPKAKTEIVVDGVKYTASEALPPSSKKIVVLQRGWVVIGDLRKPTAGDEHVLTNASVIRVWGTTKGLGQLVDGPTAKTVLDPAGIIRYNALTAVLTIDVDAEKW